MALSISPPASARAFLQSMKPAPVRSRSSLTCAAPMAGRMRPTRRSGRVVALGLLGRLARELGGDLLGRGFGRRLGDGRLGPGDTVARQEIVIVGVGFERERGPTGERRHQLVRGT